MKNILVNSFSGSGGSAFVHLFIAFVKLAFVIVFSQRTGGSVIKELLNRSIIHNVLGETVLMLKYWLCASCCFGPELNESGQVGLKFQACSILDCIAVDLYDNVTELLRGVEHQSVPLALDVIILRLLSDIETIKLQLSG